MLQKPTNLRYMLGLLLLSLALPANALEFRSIAFAKAILYDAPSLEASKLYILSQSYPVELIVNLNNWVKVRDAAGALSWVESKSLSSKRTVLVLAKTDIKSAEDPASALVATVEKDVVLELLPIAAKNGWVKVKHRDGVSGFVQLTNLWGVN